MTGGFALVVAVVAVAAVGLVLAPLLGRGGSGRAVEGVRRSAGQRRRPEWLVAIALGAVALVLVPAALVAMRDRVTPGLPVGAPRSVSDAPPPAAAPFPSGEASIEGVVVNGTNGLPAAGQMVVLTVADEMAAGAERRVTADDAGRFRFDSLADGSAYELVVGRGNVAYRSGAFRPGEMRAPVELRTYDTTDRDPGLRVDRAVLVVAAVDARRREVVAHEIVTLVNPSVHTYVPGPEAGPMGLLRFSLPPGAHDLTPTLGLRAEETVQVDRGFAVLGAVTPGTHEYGFSYRFPYSPGTFAFALSWPYGVGALRVLAPPEGPAIGGAQLAPQGATSLEEQPYRVWAAQALPPGGRLTLELHGLPGPPAVALLDAVAHPWSALLVLAGVVLLVAGWRLRPPKSMPTIALEATVRIAPSAARVVGPR